MQPNDFARDLMWARIFDGSPLPRPRAWTALVTSVQSEIGNLPPGIAAPLEAAFLRLSAVHSFVAVATIPPATRARSDAWRHSVVSYSIGIPSSHTSLAWT